VICCGNVSVGGAGKTTVALDLGARLGAEGRAVHFLTRGYGGHARGVVRVTANSTAAEVGDEPLLLAEVAPTWVGGNRAETARSAIAAGAHLLIMDDGLQNPKLHKTLSMLVIDGRTGFGNGHLLPAGPLREPIAQAASRCHAAVIIGEDRYSAFRALPGRLPVLYARIVPGRTTRGLAGQRVLAFAGIASPEKFFATLEEVGAEIVHRIGFADHHAYQRREIENLLRLAAREMWQPVTTAKDAVRLPADLRMQVVVADIALQWADVTGLQDILARV
jgi:tetraacyldisaccharide 4'-kinase